MKQIWVCHKSLGSYSIRLQGPRAGKAANMAQSSEKDGLQNCECELKD